MWSGLGGLLPYRPVGGGFSVGGEGGREAVSLQGFAWQPQRGEVPSASPGQALCSPQKGQPPQQSPVEPASRHLTHDMHSVSCSRKGVCKWKQGVPEVALVDALPGSFSLGTTTPRRSAIVLLEVPGRQTAACGCGMMPPSCVQEKAAHYISKLYCCGKPMAKRL